MGRRGDVQLTRNAHRLKWLFTGGWLSDHTLPAVALAFLEILVELDPWGQNRLREKGQVLKKQMADAMGENCIIVFPALPTTAPEHGYVLFSPPYVVFLWTKAYLVGNTHMYKDHCLSFCAPQSVQQLAF